MANDISLSQAQDKGFAAAPLQGSNNNPLRQESQAELQMREALVLWLRWNAAHEQATERLFEAGQSPEKIEDLMDWLEQMRREAVKISRELLDA